MGIYGWRDLCGDCANSPKEFTLVPSPAARKDKSWRHLPRTPRTGDCAHYHDWSDCDRGIGMANVEGVNKIALVVGGGPAPGINGVISSTTLEALDHGIEVIGFRDGFKWLAKGVSDHHQVLTVNDVKGIQ